MWLMPSIGCLSWVSRFVISSCENIYARLKMGLQEQVQILTGDSPAVAAKVT
jgi:hypothetical protein